MSHGTSSILLLIVRYGPRPSSRLSYLEPRPWTAATEMWNTIHTLLLVRYGTSPTLTSLPGTYKYHTDNKYKLSHKPFLRHPASITGPRPEYHPTILCLGLTPGSSTHNYMGRHCGRRPIHTKGNSPALAVLADEPTSCCPTTL